MLLLGQHKVHPLPAALHAPIKDTVATSSNPIKGTSRPRLLRAIKNMIGVVSSLRRYTRQYPATVHVNASLGVHQRLPNLSFIDYNPEACCVIDLSGAIIAANSQFQSIFGGGNVFNLIHSRDLRRLREVLQERNSSLTTIEQCLTVYVGIDGSNIEHLYDWSVGFYMNEYAVLTAKYGDTS